MCRLIDIFNSLLLLSLSLAISKLINSLLASANESENKSNALKMSIRR